MIDIIYFKLTYVFRCVLPLKTIIRYIYRLRGTMQYNQQLYVIYSSYMIIIAKFFPGFQNLSLPSTTLARGDLSQLHWGQHP
jgi:hypothetical protein